MDSKTRSAIIALPIVLLIAVGLALAGSAGDAKVLGLPLYAVCVALAFIIQWVVFIPAYTNQTEKYFDLTGSITYITVMTVALIFSPKRDLTTILLYVLVLVWAARLGTFLYRRIQAAGEDRRFRDLKTSFFRFLNVWTLQGLWVSFSIAAALAAITTETRSDSILFAVIGGVVWLVGFGFEAIADQQKNQFRADPQNKGKFIHTGLWAWSRHPNYFGEIVLWIGIAIIALPALRGWQFVMLISPVFITLLLTRISGVPMLEERADEKWGGQPDYEAYKAQTPVLVPRPPEKN